MGKRTQVNIAEMRHRVTFQSLSRVSDGQGGQTDTWSDVATVWALLEPVTERERLYGQKLEYQRSHKLKMRYRSDISTEMRVNFDNRTFHVKGFHSPDERKVYTFVDLEENEAS